MLGIVLAFAILIGALILFVYELHPIDFVALAVLAVILVLHPLLKMEPWEVLSGFSNPATITVLAMFILSGGIYRTGAINWIARSAIRFAGKSEFRQLLTIMLIVSPISAFINNTAAVAILIPLVISLARTNGQAPSKLMMPLSFFSQLAGVVTLVGTSTNILASELSAEKGYGAFKMFDFAKIGVCVFATGVVYIFLAGRKLLPLRRPEADIADSYRIKEYVTELIVTDKSPLIGKSLVQSHLSQKLNINIFNVIRNGQSLDVPFADLPLNSGDILFIGAQTEQLKQIINVKGLEIAREAKFRHELRSDDGKDGGVALWEVVLGPNSDLIGNTLQATNFRQRFNCIIIAIQKHGKTLRGNLGGVRLKLGDTLLLRGPSTAINLLREEPGFILTQELDRESYRTHKIPFALAIVVSVVLVAAFGIPILISSVVGCVLMVLTGCLTMKDLHASIRWDVIFLLAGILPLGLALERTGGAQLIADLAARLAHHLAPIAVLAIFYAITMLLTELISNNAAVVVMIPIAAASAESVGLDAKAIFLAIMFAASTSFSTPVGYQTNAMILGPAGYRFLDFLRVGGPLNIILAIATPFYIYFLWGI